LTIADGANLTIADKGKEGETKASGVPQSDLVR